MEVAKKYISKDVCENILADYISEDKTYWKNEYQKSIKLISHKMELHKCVFCNKQVIVYKRYYEYGNYTWWSGNKNEAQIYGAAHVLFLKIKERLIYEKKFGVKNLYYFHLSCHEEDYIKNREYIDRYI